MTEKQSLSRSISVVPSTFDEADRNPYIGLSEELMYLSLFEQSRANLTEAYVMLVLL